KEKTVQAIVEVLKEPSLKLFAIEISLDGMQGYHNRLRGSDFSFQKALDTYDALVELQKKDSRLRIHAVSTVNTENMDEVRQLSTYLYESCPAMDHHNIALIRGDRKNPSLQGPDLKAYEVLFSDIQHLWAPREEGRFGSIVDPMLQWAKVQTANEQRQVVPCCAGVLSAVVYANGDVSVCENLPPIGSLRQKSFKEIWHSYETGERRLEIKNKKCYCTNEMFLWPSIVFQPLYLIKVMLKAKVWRKPVPLKAKEERNNS
ncbi:MAG: SPASM domain-containing protein, partial [Planctomycetota bacterium]